MDVLKLLVEAAKVTFGAIAMILTFGFLVFGVPTLIIVGSKMWLGGPGGCDSVPSMIVGVVGVIFYLVLLVLIMDKPMKAVGLAIVASEVGSG